MFIHSSPEKIETIRDSDLFGSFLFFVAGETPRDAYCMGDAQFFYVAEVADDAVIEASRLWYQDNYEDAQPIIDEAMTRWGVDEDTAMGLIDGSINVYDIDIEPEDLGEASWACQRMAAEAARAMGFVGVEVDDEQGTSYMLDCKKVQLRELTA